MVTLMSIACGFASIVISVDNATVGDADAYRLAAALLVEGTFAEGVILETLILSVLNYDTSVASAAARMVSVALDRPIAEMGSRRTNEHAAVAAARAAYIAGFAATSNMEAGRAFTVLSNGFSSFSTGCNRRCHRC